MENCITPQPMSFDSKNDRTAKRQYDENCQSGAQGKSHLQGNSIEPDNVRDHRAGTSNHPFQNHAQVRLRVHHIVIPRILRLGCSNSKLYHQQNNNCNLKNHCSDDRAKKVYRAATERNARNPGKQYTTQHRQVVPLADSKLGIVHLNVQFFIVHQ